MTIDLLSFGLGYVVALLSLPIAIVLAMAFIDWREARRVTARSMKKGTTRKWDSSPPMSPPDYVQQARATLPLAANIQESHNRILKARDASRAEVWTPVPRPSCLETGEHPIVFPETDPRFSVPQRPITAQIGTEKRKV